MFTSNEQQNQFFIDNSQNQIELNELNHSDLPTTSGNLLSLFKIKVKKFNNLILFLSNYNINFSPANILCYFTKRQCK